MRVKRYILFLILNVCALAGTGVGVGVRAYAQTDTIRYVRTKEYGGAYNNDGRSWETAKDRVQDAINDLRDYLAQNHLSSGSVYIAAGSYVPTESTESTGGSMLNTSFKIYAGIHVYGGFNPGAPESRPGLRKMINGKTCDENWSRNAIGTTSATDIASQWDLQHKTILTGNHSGSPVSYTFDSIRGRFNTTYPASSYHVVWFATNGKYEMGTGDAAGHYKPLERMASLDGCVISSGNASSRSTTTREHTAYGGGVYMVGNTRLRNCIVERCNATLRGGGIYADGGGEIEFCYVHTCQSVGVGVVQGYGGGVCIDYEGSIGHSHITSCAARCGGGLLISHVKEEYPVTGIAAVDTISYYSPFATACVINNNTANAEGGGVYLANGGTVNHCTVTANSCTGPDVTYYGRRHGRSGGIYVRNCGMIFNSVFWGSRCATNNDIQFASVRQANDTTGQEVFVFHSAFMNHDISDWTGVTKEMVFSLEKNNLPIKGSTGNFPCFFEPTADPTDWSHVDASEGLHGPGVFMHLARLTDIPGPRIWHLTSYSGLDQKGVQATESVQDISPWLRHAHTDYGVVSNPYEPVSTLGALVRRPDPLTYALVPLQGHEGREVLPLHPDSVIPTLFIDPARKGTYDEYGRFVENDHEGDDWETPIRDLGAAIEFFRQYLVDDNHDNHHYMIPALNPVTHQADGEPTRYDYVQILVKEGTLTTAGPGNYLDWNIRSAAIRMESHMRLYGGYPASLTGTNTDGRNPRSYKSYITANITGIQGERGYANNSGHVIVMGNVEHSIVDGFTLSDANTHNVYYSQSAHAGGGVLINNANTAPERRIHMVGNQLRNCVINNCTSPKGAAVYVNGEHLRSDGEVSYAELLIQNCIIRNNKADYNIYNDSVENHGIITANGRAYVHIEHCTVVNNVGFPFKADSKETDTDEPIHCNHPEHQFQAPYHGFIRVDNSLIYCNGDRTLNNISDFDNQTGHVTSVNADGQDYVFGKWNMFDADPDLHDHDPHQPRGFFANDYTVPILDHFMPDGTDSHFVDDIDNVPADSASRANKCIFSRDVSSPNYPSFVNPARNVGYTPDGDKPLYGGIVAYAPLTTNPCVNAAHPDDYTEHDNYDRSDVLARDRGGAPDVGAVENGDLPAAGSVIYVTPDGAGKRDGSSWDNAIAGNTVYRIESVAGPGLAAGDQIDAEPTCDRVLDSGGSPVLTTDSKYCGGWGRVWFTEKKTGVTSTRTITKTWTTEKNVYDDGPRADEEEYIQTDAESESTNTISTSGSTPEGFVAGYDFDPRYPYGEISGASRSFWRANPYHNGTDWNNSKSYANVNDFTAACNANGWINNARTEKYVGGLQYAVEKASAKNKTYKDSVQVWVGAGKYTDYKGFIMRDSVTVYGGFPAGKYPAPAMSERQALMSDVVNIPKSLPAKDFNAADYESLLQISDVNPENIDSTLNTAAVKYWDDDYAYSEQTQTTQYEYKTRTIVHHYTYHADEQVGSDVQDTYMKYANMTAGTPTQSVSTTNKHDDGVTDGIHYWSFGESSDGKDCWHMSYPEKTNYVANIENSNNNNNKPRAIYDPETHNRLTGADASYTGNWIFIGNGSLTGLVLWQNLSGVLEGKYQISVDIAGGYRNKFSCTDNTKMYFRVYDANGTKCAEANIKTRGSYSGYDNATSGPGADQNRNMAYRHVLLINQPTTGALRIAVEVEDGVRSTGPGGGDPDPIPASYISNYGANNPNRREFWISNIHIKPVIPGGVYALDGTDDVTVNNDAVPHEDPVVEEAKLYTPKNHRITLRKRVLTMPDVCVPTYGAGSVGDPAAENRGKLADGLSHTHRVFGPTKAKRTSWESSSYVKEDPHYVEYNEANWDGFTIRHGFIADENMAHGGGAGVNMYEGAHLRNCIVVNNMSICGRVKGGGIFCDGATSTIEGCFALNNLSAKGTNTTQNQIFAGGMFMYEGTCFNSLFANNYSHGSAGGLGFCVGQFFNNTVAYNTCNLKEDGKYSGGAISLATSSSPNLFVANTIIYGNNGIAIRDRNTAINNVNPFLHCYIQSEVAHPYDATNQNVIDYGIDNIYLNGVAPSADNTPFAADFVNGVYTPGNASATNDFQLISTAGCVNKGTEDFAGEFYTALRHKGKTDAQIKAMAIYQSVSQTTIPANDVAFAKRVQDCQIDIGAYEFNAAYSIRPDTTTHPGHAIFYTAYVSPGGDASARSPHDAACLQKLQLVLDAAGRYKYKLMTEERYDTVSTIRADHPGKQWTVEVWLEGDSVESMVSDDPRQWYTPTRSTKHSVANYVDNTLDYSFIVPRGVQVKGGYTSDYYHYEDAAGNTVAAGTEGAHVVDERDPLTYRTVLSGKITSNTGAEGNCYHVVTFTNDLFDVNEKVIDDGGQLAAFTDEKDRAVIDGLFLEDGYANAPDPEDRIGAGCIVTDFAHVRNCVIRNNEAQEYGGGLYLKPFALVSGTIIKDNKADIGGGVYIEAPASLNIDSLAHIYASTICQNTASASAGGVWFDNTYARVNSTAVWHNEANDNANVSGNFSRSSDETDYPFNYCAVESRRLEGQGNIELSPRETEGVRWDNKDPFHLLGYYPITMSSTLSRAGMTYSEWDRTRAVYKTLDSMDIASVHRSVWSVPGIERGYAWKTDTLVVKQNDFIDIGARAINKDFRINVDPKYVMRRIFVMHTDLLDSEAARALQDNTLNNDTANMYRQMGSCSLNPFHRLGDALDYIIEARKAVPDKYRNARFEVYVEQGTYYPFHNAYREQDQVRTNTFLIPEATSVVGGIDSKLPNHNYCQAGYADRYTNTLIGDGNNIVVRLADGGSYTLNYAPADSIRLQGARHRPMRDYNLNSVIEPWEFERQTILSGNAVSGDAFTHVYHVITAHADSTIVGPQPIRYRTDLYDTNFPHWKEGPQYRLLANPIAPGDDSHYEEECDLSIAARAIILDGLQITGGYANHLNPEDTIAHIYQTKTYFRGGGIFIDGNWKESFDDTDPSGIPNVTEPAKYNIPLVVRNSSFTDNMAGNGGGIYSNGDIHVYSCHFTQNYSQGPITKLDQSYIPWTAGGCIATNAYCGVVNTLFDNNEARRGLYPINVKSESERIPDADARQGFGGVLSVAAQSRTRVGNCHFMKNKAVAYSAIYNFLANNRYSTADSMQFAFNTIFWGNEVFDVDNIGELEHVEAPSQESIDAFNLKYKASRAGVFHYDGSVWDRYERLYHEYDSLYNYYFAKDDTFNVKVTDKLAELRAVGDSMEGLYFCSYRKTYGPTGMKPTKDGFLMTRDELKRYTDSRQFAVPLKQSAYNTDIVENYDTLFTYVHGNNNVLINRLNTATDGPNFKQPSFVAGIDGYMQNADWLLARMNLTTDQGWGHLRQRVTQGISYYITKYTGARQFKTAAEALLAAKEANPDATEADVYAIRGLPVASFHGITQPVDENKAALYNFLAKRSARHTLTLPRVPIDTIHYMEYTRSSNEEETTGEMYRISMNPKFGENDVYIDMGIYEYQYVQLDIKGQEIDTMWVATKTRGEKHDGVSWESPTTDLQTAIDMLMSSHNNHDKYICFLGDEEGTFSPANVLDNRRAFVISSNSLAPLLPDSAVADYDYGVKSLNFLGGYSFDVKDAKRDPQAHPVVVEMPNTGNANQLNQLFIVEDMTRQMVQANWQGEYTSRDSVVIPVLFDGITFINPYSTKDPASDGLNNLGGQMSKKGGAAIYYRWQRRYEGDGGVFTPNFNMALHPDSALIDKKKTVLPKLTISNCVFMDNGARTAVHAERSPAVRIDHGGGSSLIVNSLFHSNAGAPVYARTFDVLEEENDLARVPNDVVIVNSTFALNDGHIRLESDSSEVHNSLIWLDDLDNDTTVQLQLGADQWDKTTNSTRAGTKHMTHNAVWGCFRGRNKTAEAFNNDSLVTDNSDVFKGPGFVEPFVTATTSEQRRERSFLLNPSVMTFSKADSSVYRKHVFFRVYPDTMPGGEKLYWRRSNGFKSAPIYTIMNDSDLAAKPRYTGDGMERGAYECLAVLQRVLYVQPNLPAFSAGDGSSWLKPFGQGQLQNAIDAAAVYTYLRQDQDPETRKAYVFVKGSNGVTDYTAVMARDGVSVYGSLPGSFNDTAVITVVGGERQFTNAECRRYINYVRSLTTGVASPNANPTYINSVHMTGDEYGTGFLMDGFVISNPGSTHTSSPIVLDNTKTALRNCLVTDNRVEGAPVADVRKGLLYNCLIYGDSASSLVRVGANGLVLNNTIVATDSLVAPLDSAAAPDGAVLNNIAVNSQRSTVNCFAPYMTQKVPYTLPGYLTNKPVLAFQLHEHSAAVNGGTESLPSLFDAYTADSTIHFGHDRDVLGNPRRLGGTVDLGALETWRVEPKQVYEITALTNQVFTQAEIEQASDAQKRAAFLSHYGGNSYPHPGSVVYLMDSSAMTMQCDAPQDFQTYNGDPIIFRPAYMLLKPGASFYGNGHEVRMDYLAVEKHFQNKRFSLTAMPFDYNVNNITASSYNAENDSLSIFNSQLSTVKYYQYSGAARSAKDYVFRADSSSLWLPVDTLVRTANDGYLMDFGAEEDTVLRFNAFAAADGQYVYTEETEDKPVYLTQYDHRTAGSGTELNFTRQEDMGWNIKGLPWLVSNYRTDTVLEGETYLRQMYIPHVFYEMDGTYRSWDRGTTMALGEAFLTQTATQKEREQILFHLPYYDHNEKASRPIVRLMSVRPQGMTPKKSNGANGQMGNCYDQLVVIPDSTVSKTVQYTYGRDGIKWSMADPMAQLYVLDSKGQSRISLLGAAPTEVDIPVGISVPTAGSFVFNLPEKDAFSDYRYVWIIDKQKNRTVNLLEDDYNVELESGVHNDRFALRIGGFPLTDAKGHRRYIVYVYNRILHIRGLVEGDKIDIYTSSGQHVYTTKAATSEWTLPLSWQTGFVVTVNDCPYKVVSL